MWTEIGSAVAHLHFDRAVARLRGTDLHLSGFWTVLESTWPTLKGPGGLPVWRKTKQEVQTNYGIISHLVVQEPSQTLGS